MQSKYLAKKLSGKCNAPWGVPLSCMPHRTVNISKTNHQLIMLDLRAGFVRDFAREQGNSDVPEGTNHEEAIESPVSLEEVLDGM